MIRLRTLSLLGAFFVVCKSLYGQNLASPATIITTVGSQPSFSNPNPAWYSPGAPGNMAISYAFLVTFLIRKNPIITSIRFSPQSVDVRAIPS
jgi:hypothetical protein